MAPPERDSAHPITAHYLFIDLDRKNEKLSWLNQLSFLTWLADLVAVYFTHISVTHQLQVEHRTGKVRRSQTDVLPLCHATN